MEINQKARIVQIITEKESSNMMGTYKILNNDWLNIIDKGLFDYQQSKKYKTYKIIFWSSFPISVIIFSLSYFLKINWLFWPGAVFLILTFYSSTKDIPKNYHYPIIGRPIIPIQKPHDFKVGDEVNIKMEINHVPV